VKRNGYGGKAIIKKLGMDFRGFGLEGLGRFRKFAKLKIVLKVENRSCGRFLFFSALW
jgi:hypothetical protein